MKTTIAILFALLGLTGLATPAAALEGGQVVTTAFAQTVALTSTPIGHADYCARTPTSCRANLGGLDRITLTAALWDELQLVNNTINTTIIPAIDMDLYGVEEYWTYPTSGYGDCEDFVLAKREILIEMGWDPAVLLITVVRQANGDGHAVLTVRTDRGDLILDNQEGLIRVWNETPYAFVKRQSQHHAAQWVDIDDPRAGFILAAR